jgi:hypothetical protein
MKRFFKRLLLFLGVALIVIQFFRPDRNIAAGPAAFKNDMTTIHNVPSNVQAVFQKACNDCHSNNTRYPWYSQVQPLAWWLADHIKEGKKELNFSEFATYSLRRRYRKLEEIATEVEAGEMPLSSYTFIHKDAKLTAAEKTAIINWTTGLRDSMQAVYPLDSLVRKKQ